MADFSEDVYRVVRAVARGKVVSYGGVAAILGRPRAARGVGSALGALTDGNDVPWWRVVNRNGEISIKGVVHGPALQRALLEREGVRFDRCGRIDWKRFGWFPDELQRPDDLLGHDADACDVAGAVSSESIPRTLRTVSVAISRPRHRGQLLLVHRPPDDPDLPNAWGLPATTLRRSESWEQAAHRVAHDKLGVEIGLGRELSRGSTLRGNVLLTMRLFRATLRAGEPCAPQPAGPGTQYTDWRWDSLEALRPAAERGSLCCSLALGGRPLSLPRRPPGLRTR